MFSGIVEERGTVVALPTKSDQRLRVDAAGIAPHAHIGDSIAVSGCCLTVTQIDGHQVAFDVMPETLRRTSLAAAEPGGRVNLEASLRFGDKVGGHLVSGHVDAVGVVKAAVPEGNAQRVQIEIGQDLMTMVAPQGCIAVDGVSLTVVSVGEDNFWVSLIPHTLVVTTAGGWKPGVAVNVEVDLTARYVQRLMAGAQSR